MTLLESTDLAAWIDRTVVDESGDKIGKVATIYFDDDTQEPAWIAVATGWLGNQVSFVPVRNATEDAGGLRVPYSKAQVKDAPNAEADGHLEPDEEAALYRHYGIPYGDTTPSSADAKTGGPGHDTSGPDTDDAMTRSEEELRVGTATREKGRVRLRKFVVDEETVDETLRKERIDVEGDTGR